VAFLICSSPGKSVLPSPAPPSSVKPPLSMPSHGDEVLDSLILRCGLLTLRVAQNCSVTQ
jgi:hypothetical protein